MPLVFVHAADYHLGADLRRFGAVREKLEEAQYRALERTLQEAADNNAAFVVISGDFFDRRRPRPGAVKRASEILAARADMPVYILPGTHDFLSENSIYWPDSIDWAGKNVTILNNSALSPVNVAGTEAILYFRVNHSNRSAESPIAGIKRQSEDGYHIGLAHGSMKIMGLDIGRDFPIDPVEIEKTGLDYLALGHWHKSRTEKYGRTTVVYPGIPQPLSWSDPGEGSIAVVRLDDTREAGVNLRPAGPVLFREIKGRIYHPVELNQLLESVEEANTIVKLSLEYSDNLKEVVEIERIIEQASSRFILVQKNGKNDGNSSTPLNIPDKTHDQLIEAFRAELARLKAADSAERAELYDRAAELGVAIITGEE